MAERTQRGARRRGPGGAQGPGADAGHAPQNGITPLHAAADHGHLEVARLLLEVGADINAKAAVSGRSVGDAGLGVRTRRGFGEG